MLPILIATAAAADVTVTREGAHVVGIVELEAPADAVRALVRDPLAVARASGQRMDYTSLGPDGDCVRYRLSMPTLLGAIGGLVRVCDTAAGSAVTMLESEDFATYRYEWRVESLADGRSRLTYDSQIELDSFVPDAIERASLVSAMRRTMRALGGWKP